jgi:SAM-dependent methyltransferase
MSKTLDYYNTNADKFVAGTVSVDFNQVQDKFLGYLSEHALILDFGCGSGRDTKCFLKQGYQVEAIDGSEELCKAATKYTGIEVKQMLFQELDAVDKYDGIWACSSILHLSKAELSDVIGKMIKALKNNGVIYTSFKYGDFEGEKNGRYFTNFTEESFGEYIKDISNIVIEEYWISSDVRPDRDEEKWLNLILRRRD